MLRIAYTSQGRLPIEKYTDELGKGKIYCLQGHPLVAKRGEKKQHHYSHAPGYGSDCHYSDGKTSWHLWWQGRLKSSHIEYRFNKEILKISDAVNIQENRLNVIEFQNSKMDAAEIELRETFYSRADLLSDVFPLPVISRLTWVFNLSDCSIDIQFVWKDFVCFTWEGGSKYMLHAKARTFFDFGKRDLIQFLDATKIKTDKPMIIGRLISIEKLDKLLFKDILVDSGNLDQRQNRYGLLPDEFVASFEESDYKFTDLSKDEDPNLQKVLSSLKSYYYRDGKFGGTFKPP